MKVETLDRTQYFRALIYGDSGAGKTTLLGSAMECEAMSPMLVLNAGGQPVSFRAYNPPPLVLTVETMKDFNPIYQWLEQMQPGWFDKGGGNGADGPLADTLIGTAVRRYFEMIEQPIRFRSLGVDSITHIQRIALEQLTGKVALPGNVPPQTQISHWGRALAMMTNLADKYFKLPLHVMMTALTRRDTIESMGLTLFCPFLWGQSSLEVPSHAEVVGRLRCSYTISPAEQQALEKKFKGKIPFNVVYLRGGRDYIAKWQGVTNPPAVIAGPTASKFIEVMRRDEGKDKPTP